MLPYTVVGRLVYQAKTEEEQINVVCSINENKYALKTTKVYRVCANMYNLVRKNLVYFLGFQRFGITLDFHFFVRGALDLCPA